MKIMDSIYHYAGITALLLFGTVAALLLLRYVVPVVLGVLLRTLIVRPGTWLAKRTGFYYHAEYWMFYYTYIYKNRPLISKAYPLYQWWAVERLEHPKREDTWLLLENKMQQQPELWDLYQEIKEAEEWHKSQNNSNIVSS